MRRTALASTGLIHWVQSSIGGPRATQAEPKHGAGGGDTSDRAAGVPPSQPGHAGLPEPGRSSQPRRPRRRLPELPPGLPRVGTLGGPDAQHFILSAKYGLVRLDHMIEPYEQRMAQRGERGARGAPGEG